MPTHNPVAAQFGESIDLGLCLIGKNLNLMTVRGFAALDVLAAISAPDVYDQIDNPSGTQRDLKPKHAAECFGYALDSLAATPEDDPRFFPDIILNARDANVVELYDPEDEGDLYEVTSFSGEEEIDRTILGVRIRASDLEYPKPTKSPQISRVDGNHRLSQTDEVLAQGWIGAPADDEDEIVEYPSAAFSLLLSLDQLQEAKLFRDINGGHEGMETAHLDTIAYRIGVHSEMKADPRQRPLWMAHQLTATGRAFDGMVFLGGSRVGLRKSVGAVPPIRINALKSTIATMLRSAPTVLTTFGDKPDLLLELVDRYWKCVKAVFPDAWQDRREYILLQAIGLGAFAKFGGTVLERALTEGHLEQHELMNYVAPVAQVPMERKAYEGIAGAGGADYVARRLIEAATSDEILKQQAIAKLTASMGGGNKKTALD